MPAKLYAIFALLATVTVALAAIAAANASRHAALTAEFGAAFKGGQNIERINALSYALLAQTRASISPRTPPLPTSRPRRSARSTIGCPRRSRAGGRPCSPAMTAASPN